MKATASPFFVAQDWERALFQYAETLPKDSLIAGSPCSLAELPIFGKRQILFSCYRPNRDPQIMLDGLRAYYEETATEILPICEKYGIDYLLVQPNDLTQKYIAQGHYNEPYDSILQQELAGQASFALLNVPDDLKIFSYDSFYMVACDQSLLLVDELP